MDNIFEYMVEIYINGNHSTLRRLYHELNKEARKDFIGFLLVECPPQYHTEILQEIVWPPKWTDINRTTEKIPTWSLAYIINGDATALTDDEVQTIDRWMKQWQVQDVSPLTDEEGNAQPYFTHYPLFGLPTEVEDCEILYLNDNPTKI